MKQPGFINFLLTSLAIIFLTSQLPALVNEPAALLNILWKPHYAWQKAAPAGRGCFPPNCAEGQYPMAIIPLIAFENKLWSVGDQAVWSSSDGLNWKSEPKTDWGERYGNVFVFFNEKIWMLGGMKSWDDFRNDVWSSSDGKIWKQVTKKTGWPARRGHSVLVFKNKLWLFGGAESSGRADETPTRFLNDVWSSSDGINWIQETANAPWTARAGQTALVFDGKIWLIGGEGHRDIWNTADGKNWILAADNAPWSERQNNGGLVFDDKIWIFGGRGLNDGWYSTDGKRWFAAFSRAPWSTRTAFHSVVFNDKIWLFSGKTGREDSWEGDIWTMSRKTIK